MTVEIFWQLIEKARSIAGANDNAFASALQTELISLSEEDLLLFQFIYEWYEIMIIKQPSHLIWSALVLINGGYCTDTYGFAGYLITHGREAYEKTLADLGDKVTEGEKSAVEGAIEDLKKLKDNSASTAKEIRDGIEKLMKSFEPISQKLYEQAQSAQNAQNAGESPQDAPSQDDGVVDADYTEVKDDDNK